MKNSTRPASKTLAPTKMYSVTCEYDEYTTLNFGLFSSKKKAERFVRSYKMDQPMSIEKKFVSPEHWTPIIEGDEPEVLRSKIEKSSVQDDVDQLIKQAKLGAVCTLAQIIRLTTSGTDYYAEDMLPAHKLFSEYSNIVVYSFRHRSEEFWRQVIFASSLGRAYRHSLL